MAAIHEQLLVVLDHPEEGQIDQTQPNRWEQVIAAAGGTSEGMLKLLGDYEPLYQRAAVMLALPHLEYEDQMKQFSAEVQRSPNPFASLTFPAIEKARLKEFAILVELAMVRAAVEYKLHGDAGLQSVTDPCGQGPFGFERFVFQGVDRGFELKSAYDYKGSPYALIFVEQDGPPFYVNANSVVGKKAGQPVSR